MDLNKRFPNQKDHKMLKNLKRNSSSSLYSFVNKFICILFIFLLNLKSSNARNYFDHLNYNGRCEEIQISFCRDLPYNQTILPNLFNHQSQDIARNHLRTYEPLIKLKCSPYLQLFLCTLYAPICLNSKEPIPPCRNLCLSAKNGCEKHIPSDWDKKFNCSNFPLFDNQALCIWKPDDYESINLINKERSFEDASSVKDRFHYHNSSSKQFRFSCPIQFSTTSSSSRRGQFFNLNGKKYSDCATPCDLYLEKDQKETVRYWISFWSFVCLLSSTFTFLTFFIDTKRFQYPEKQIVFLSLCYMFISLIYFVGSLAKDQIACAPLISNLISDYNLEMIKSVLQGNSNAYCTLMAMTLYYFTMASAIWFVLLTISWYIQMGPKWSHESIEKKAHYYHLIAWTLPAIQTIIFVSKNQLEGDQLSGVCYVGLLDRDNLLIYLFWPLAICLSVGTVFLVIAIIELKKIGKMLVNKDTARQRIVMLKIVLFGFLYVIPNFILIICYYLEYNSLDKWTLSWLSRTCTNKEYGIPCPNLTDEEEQQYKPSLKLFLIKYFTLLITGLTSGVWVWSSKTFVSWRKFWKNKFVYM